MAGSSGSVVKWPVAVVSSLPQLWAAPALSANRQLDLVSPHLTVRLASQHRAGYKKTRDNLSDIAPMWERGWKPARCVDILTTSQSVSVSGRGWRPTVFLSPRTPTLWASSPARPRPLTTATAPTVNTTWACPACRTTSAPPLPLLGFSTGNMRTEKYTPCLGANNTTIQQPPLLLRKFVLFQHCKIINHLGIIIFPSYPSPSS